ncbi:hypothetical protein F8M41_010180 [Gigaspora margarita]|uniref:Uncharacterized protein n=1 Tax=Gigaspora margarita TaxID=4874 RepID=A0A8H4EQE3_GIGMA|nr:hypothetical protein F8M41_010180 [Gigaspora margarita]
MYNTRLSIAWLYSIDDKNATSYEMIIAIIINFLSSKYAQEFNLAIFDIEDIILVIDIQKLLLNTNTPIQVLWKVDKQNNFINIAKTLTAKFNNETIKIANKKPSPLIKGLSVIKPSSKNSKPYTGTRSCHKLTDLAKKALTNSNQLDTQYSISEPSTSTFE